MKRINHILIAAMVLVMVVMFANANIPPAPAGLDNETGDYWVNYTWSKDTDHPDNGNVTDSFNVSMNSTWYNGTATFLNEGVGPGGWANITVWAYNATGNGNRSAGSVSDNVQAPAMVDPPDDNPCTIMHPDSETLMEWIARYNAAPKVNISGEGFMDPPEYSVLDRLDYNATERSQGSCGNCWVWAGTGCMEVAHDVENDVFDRLSIQYLNSLYYDSTGDDYACEGGTLGKFTDFYSVNTTFAVPWNNTNASWQDGGDGSSTTVPADSIATMPHYAITHIEECTIPTQGVGNDTAIENIKNVLASDTAVWFAFYLPNNADWDNFTDFWLYDPKTDLWSPDYSCGHTWVDGEGGGHAVLCVGYNDTNGPETEPYWIMLNSWGNRTNRPNGLFQMNMDINYDCYFVDGGNHYSLEWQMLDIDFADICVNETGWWRDGSVFHTNVTTPIQAAVDNATAGETICVAAGDYHENVNIGTSNLTLRGEGADVVNVRADSTSDHVFDVTADWVNISGFNVTGATGSGKAGIHLNERQHCNISDNNASGNYYGIYLRYSSNNALTGNTANSNNGYGIRLYYSSNNALTNNTANSNNYYGTYLDYSSSNTLSNNMMSGNDYNFGVYADSLSDYAQNIDMSNTVDGKPIYYWVDQQGGQIPTDAGYVGVVNSTNTIVRDLNMAKNLQGILFVNTSNSIIENVTASGNWVGIYLESSSNNTLTDNTVNSNGDNGIYLSSSSNNTLTDNTVNSNGLNGISLDSNNNTLSNNTALDNVQVGIGMWDSNNNILTDNTASNNGYGIYLQSSSNNMLTSNTASNNGCGIMLGAGVGMAEGVGNKTASNNFGRRSPVPSNDILADNDASDKGYGIVLDAGVEMVEGASNNTLTGNDASGNEVGIWLDYSSSNTLTSNTASNNWYGIWLYDSSNNTLTGNIASNNGCGIVLGAGMMAPDSASNNTTSNNFGRRSPVPSNDILADNDASDKGYGIVLDAGVEMVEGASNNTLTGNDASGNEVGIWLDYSSSNTLTSNTASGNGEVGIALVDSSNNNTLTSNIASNNWVGIYIIEESNNNTLTGNIANSNIVAPVLPANGGPPGSGIWLEYSSNNTLSSNIASDNSDWDIYIDDSPSNTFTDNTLNGTTVSFTYSGDVSLKGVGLPAAGAPWYSIGKFIDVTNQSEGAWMILNFSYSDSDFTGDMDESNLTVWKYNGTWYEDGWNGTRYLDIANNTVGVNITSFSVFAPMTTGVPALDHINVEPGSALLNIDEPPKSQTFAATGRSKHTDPIPDLMFGWSNTDTSVGWLNNSTGTVVNFTAERVGRAYLTASNGSVTSDQVPVTVDAIADNTTVDDEKIFTATSGDATVTGTFSSNLTGWINITAIGNATNSSEVNSSNPRYGLGSGDRVVSGVIVTVCGNISNELGENGTIHIEICYNTTTLAALGIDASTLAIWKYNSTTEKWVKQSSTISGTCVYIDVDHLCTFGLVGSKATPSGGSSTGGGGGGTYPPGWFGTPTPAVTATKAPAATTTATAAPPGERVTPAPTKVKSAAAKAAAPAAEGTTAETAKKGAPGFTAVFAIAGMLAVAYAMMRRRG